jgi:hypothetical protein
LDKRVETVNKLPELAPKNIKHKNHFPRDLSLGDVVKVLLYDIITFALLGLILMLFLDTGFIERTKDKQ